MNVCMRMQGSSASTAAWTTSPAATTTSSPASSTSPTAARRVRRRRGEPQGGRRVREPVAAPLPDRQELPDWHAELLHAAHGGRRG